MILINELASKAQDGGILSEVNIINNKNNNQKK